MNKGKMGEKKRRSYVLMPPGHPIILLKSNLFNMAAVIGKKVYSIHLICSSGEALESQITRTFFTTILV